MDGIKMSQTGTKKTKIGIIMKIPLWEEDGKTLEELLEKNIWDI